MCTPELFAIAVCPAFGTQAYNRAWMTEVMQMARNSVRNGQTGSFGRGCRRVLSLAALALALGGGAAACDGEPEDMNEGEGDALERAFIETYAEIVQQGYDDAITGVATLDLAIEELTEEPSHETLIAAKQAWLLARDPFGQTEVARIAGGPMNEDAIGTINAWPIDESYIDYVEGAPESGIINDLDGVPEITSEVIRQRNRAASPEQVTSGYHAIEFVLWGQDMQADGAGVRPYTDFLVDDEDDDDSTVSNQERRATYLKLTNMLLAEDLQLQADAWEAGGLESFRDKLVEQPVKESLASILGAMVDLSENGLVIANMSMAYDTQDEEYEQSCFSDNTHNDILNGQRGIENIYFGEYGGIDGTGLAALVNARDPELDEKMRGRLQAASEAIVDMGPPFDQAILVRRDRVAAAISALNEQAATLREIATLLEVKLP